MKYEIFYSYSDKRRGQTFIYSAANMVGASRKLASLMCEEHIGEITLYRDKIRIAHFKRGGI